MPLLRVREGEEQEDVEDDEGEEEEEKNDCATNQVQPFGWTRLLCLLVVPIYT